jgi:hypothetical protein
LKKILGWIKANLVIVISLVVILVSLPLGYVFSNSWNKKIRTGREAEAKKALSDINATTVTYALPAAMPGDKPLEVKAVPTTKLTNWFAEQRELIEAEVEGVVAQATEFNQKARKPLVTGLFPQASNRRDEEQRIFAFIEELCGDPDRDKPSAYQRLISRFNAGERSDAGKLASTLHDLSERLKAANGNRALTVEEDAALTKQLTDRRIGELRRRAQEVTFYASVGAFSVDSQQQQAGWSKVPVAKPSGVPTLDECFIFQWDYWVIEDILSAIARANTDQSGEELMVERGAVKRLVSLRIKDPPIYGDGSSQPAPSRDREFGAASVAEPVFAFPGGVPLDLSVSVTGRKTNASENPVYDVREVELTLIVASDRLQSVLSAFSQTNFMTVVDLDLADVDPWAELKDGYYYGPDHVVKATIGVESVWLRSWLGPLMSPAVANNIGYQAADDGGE